MPVIGWSVLYWGINFWHEWMVQKDRMERATALARTAQLQMLRYRLSPHFLFNALNSIRALIAEDKVSARRMVTELSEYLRYSLMSRNYATVPFRDEIESIRHYFNIQKIRYENKLEVVFDVEPAAEEYPIASFLLHPLVENAVTYGMQTSSLPLKIQIKVCTPQGRLEIDVINSGSWIETSPRDGDYAGGRGLDNVRRRLADAYPERHEMSVYEKDGFVHARIVMEPLKG
jgi:LytS/YehU family sensor histidine kinase